MAATLWALLTSSWHVCCSVIPLRGSCSPILSRALLQNWKVSLQPDPLLLHLPVEVFTWPPLVLNVPTNQKAGRGGAQEQEWIWTFDRLHVTQLCLDSEGLVLKRYSVLWAAWRCTHQAGKGGFFVQFKYSFIRTSNRISFDAWCETVSCF